MENNKKELEEKEIITEEDIDKSDPENKKYDESRIYYVYKHVRLDNNTCFYIGKGKNGRKDDPNRNPTHDSICKNHKYKVVIFKDKLNEAEAFKLEEDLIRCYVFKMGYGILIKGYMNNNNKFLTNMTWGGEGASGMHHTEETKQIISEKNKGHIAWNKGKKGLYHHTEETKEKISEKVKGKMAGENHPMYGKHHSEEAKRKIGEKSKGHVAWNKGKKGLYHHTEETKEKISEKVSGEKNGMFGKNKNKGENNPFYGKHHSDEAKEKMSKNHADTSGKNNPMAKKVICTTTGKIFDCIKDAGYHYGISPDTISTCCKGKRKSSGVLNNVPLQWKYLKDYNNEFKGILINPIAE